MSAVARRTLPPLAAVTAAAFLLALLLVLVRLRWAPLESAAHGAAAHLNSLVAGHATAVSVVKVVTWLGSNGVLWTLTGLAVVVLVIRTTMLITPNQDAFRRGGRLRLGLPRRKAADRSDETATVTA